MITPTQQEDWIKTRSFDFPFVYNLADFIREFHLSADPIKQTEELSRFALFQWIDAAPADVRKAIMIASGTVVKGDFVGHPFRGNQWSDASGSSTSGGESTQESQTAVVNAWGGMFASDYDSGADAGGFVVDEKGMNDFIARQHADLSLTESERQSVNVWQSYDYADINSVLRGTAKIELFDGDVRQSIETTITDLNKILTKATLDQDVVVFRGINDEEFMFEEVVNGDIIKDAGFIATSLNPIIATMGAEGMIEGSDDWALNPLVFRIKLPKGTPAFAVEKLNGAITNPKGPFMNPDPELLAQQGYTHGSEIVLPPNTSFRVVNETIVERQRLLDLEVIPNA